MCLFFSFHTCTTTSCQKDVDCSLQRPQFFKEYFLPTMLTGMCLIEKCVFASLISTCSACAAGKTNGRATMLPLFPQFSCLSGNDLPVTEHNLASPPPPPFTTTTTTFPQHTDTNPLTPHTCAPPSLTPLVNTLHFSPEEFIF